MTWIIKLLLSSVGRKLVMSLTGLFLCSFLIVHLIGNLQLLYDDGGEAFNTYAYFMVHNPIIKFISYGLYFFILLHAVLGILLWNSNRKSKGQKYAVSATNSGSWSSKNMSLLGTLVLAFICIHMGDFWWKMKFTDELAMVSYDSFDVEVKDLYLRVSTAFQETWIVLVYVVGMIALFFHLSHGFASAFQTLGLRHPKYTPLIKGLGWAFSIIVPLLFAMIPILTYFK